MIEPYVFSSWIDAICGLSLPQQATCLLIAAKKSLPVWQHWAQQHHHFDLSEPLIACFERWFDGQASSDELDALAQRFGELLLIDLRENVDPTGGYAGYALLNAAMVALDQCDDVHRDIAYTSVLYAAAAFCSVSHEASSLRPERLSSTELEFIADWWAQCCQQFPSLPERAEDLIRLFDSLAIKLHRMECDEGNE